MQTPQFPHARPRSMLGFPPAVLALALAGCATPTLPPNARTTTAGGVTLVDQIDFSYAKPAPADFGQLKLCALQVVSNDAVTLQDSAGSFVGRFTGIYYQTDHRQTAGGGATLKYVDDQRRTLIANGTVIAPPGGGFLSPLAIRFELKASTSANQVGLVFYKLEQSQQRTGFLANTGFSPVGVWSGSRADAVYMKLQEQAEAIKSCMQ